MCKHRCVYFFGVIDITSATALPLTFSVSLYTCSAGCQFHMVVGILDFWKCILTNIAANFTSPKLGVLKLVK